MIQTYNIARYPAYINGSIAAKIEYAMSRCNNLKNNHHHE